MIQTVVSARSFLLIRMFLSLHLHNSKPPAIIVALLALISSPLVAQEAESESFQPAELSTLADYLQRAQDANPSLLAFADRYEAAKERIPQARALPDPTLQVTHFVESVQTRTGPQENILMLGQRIPWFGRLEGRGDVASAEAEAIRYAFMTRQLQLAKEVGLAFYNYAFVAESVTLTNENLTLLRRLVPIVEERTRTGESLNSLLRLQVEIGKLEDQLQGLRQHRIQGSARLAALLSLSTNEPIPWPTWAPPQSGHDDSLDLPSLLIAVDSQNPELAMLERKRVSASARAELARLEARPDFSLGVTYITVSDTGANPTLTDAGQDPWGVSLAVSLPIWAGRNTAARREADASVRAVEKEIEDRQNKLAADTQVAFSVLRDAKRRIELYEDELLPLARQALENTTAAYESASVSLLELIDSERSLLELDLSLWRAHADAAQQKIVLQTLANQPIR